MSYITIYKSSFLRWVLSLFILVFTTGAVNNHRAFSEEAPEREPRFDYVTTHTKQDCRRGGVVQLPVASYA